MNTVWSLLLFFEFKSNMRTVNGGDTERSALSQSFKENLRTMGSLNDNESIVATLIRHQKMFEEVQKELRHKVNKTDFTAGLSSKISLSEITNLTMDLSNEDSIKMNQSNTMLLQSLEEQHNLKNKECQMRIQNIEGSVKKCYHSLRKELDEKNIQIQENIGTLSKSITEGDKSLLEILEKKAQRSEMEKITNLSSLLAIEFEQIRKRFTAFENESNLIWKEISNIYQNHNNLKQEVQQSKTLKDQLQIFNAKTGRNLSVKNSFMNSLAVSGQKQIADFKQIDVQTEILKIAKSLETFKQNEQDHDYSLKLFAERLAVVQNYHESWFKSLKEIQKTRKQVNDSKEDVQNLHVSQLKLKDQCILIIKERVKDEVRFQSGSIKTEIKEACGEITERMLKIFQKCAKSEDLYHQTDIIDQLQDIFQEKIKTLSVVVKKHQEQNNHKSQVFEQKMKVLQRDIECRLKKDEFKEHRGQLITTNEAQSLVKKTENGLKKQFDNFASKQKEVNEVLCSENVLTRWAWTSGTLKGGNLVSWDRELVNTLPQNFLYSKDEHCFRIISGGIYRFELGFYSKKKPTIQIIVNGQTIISAVNSNSYVVHHSSGKLKEICVNEVSGLTYYDFFTLQENSRIAISYSGEVGHGFIGMQRM